MLNIKEAKMDINITDTILYDQQSTELKKIIYQFASDNNITIDKLSVIVKMAEADINEHKANYYAETLNSIVETFDKSNQVAKEIMKDAEGIQ